MFTNKHEFQHKIVTISVGILVEVTISVIST